MKCPKCKSKFFVKSSHLRENGYAIRNHECPTCGYTATTIEVPIERFERNDKLFLGLQDLLADID